MQNDLKPIRWSLIASLCTVAAIISALQYSGKEPLMIATNIMNLIIIVPFVVLSLILVAKNRLAGNLGKAWICFAVFATSWSIGEVIWAADEMIFKIDPFPSIADFFWLVGYVFYFVFGLLYLRPFRNSISSKTIVSAISISVVLMGFLVYYAITNSELPEFETALLTAYPVADAICLIPTIIGFTLFFRGQVNFTWLFLLVGMFSFVITDSAFQIISQTDMYYTGHPLDIPYLWAYIFFVFGVYYHNKLHHVRNMENKFNDQEKLR